MAITNIYQDLIMNPENMPNRLQNLEMFPPVDNVPGRIDFSSGDELVPGMGTPAIDFTDAPVDNIFLRQNNPTKGFLDRNFNYRALNLGTPEATAKFLTKKNFPIPSNLQGIDTRGFLDKTKSNISSGIGKGFDLGKAAIGGIASLITGIPGLGLLANAFGPMSPEDKAMRDFYGSEFGLTDTGQVASGIMAGYNPVSLFGGPGLSKSIDKRIDRITKTLSKRKSKVLEKRLKDLEALRQKEEQARERDRAARARAANAAVYADLDRRTGGKGFGDAGGFSTARAGKEGAFGTFDGSRGRKDFFKGGLAGLL